MLITVLRLKCLQVAVAPSHNVLTVTSFHNLAEADIFLSAISVRPQLTMQLTGIHSLIHEMTNIVEKNIHHSFC